VVFDGGAVVNYQGSWVSTEQETLWAGEWLIECSAGTIEWTGRADTDTASDTVIVRRLNGPVEVLTLPKMDIFDRIGSLSEFRSAIREGRPPMTSGQANLPTLALTLGAIESSTTSTPQDIPSLLRAAGSTTTTKGKN
jgi:predicted dehydrogenase